MSISRNDQNLLKINQKNKSAQDYRIVVYPVETANRFYVNNTLSKTEQKFFDKTARQDKKYQYTAKVNYSNGKKSKYYSPLVSLNATQ